jgi:type II secretory pathway component PulC
MEKNKQLTIALPVLLVAAVCVWLPNINSSVSRPKTLKGRTDQNAMGANEISEIVKGLAVPKDVGDATAEWGQRNPFDRSVLSKQVVKAAEVIAIPEVIPDPDYTEVFQINGIFWNETKPSVIINDTVLNEGSNIGEHVIKNIRPDEVVISKEGKEIVLKIKRE